MKKLLSLILSICIILSFATYSVSAADRASNYTPQYSTKISWDASNMNGYNCYGFAIENFKWIDPGELADSSYNFEESDVGKITALVKNDIIEYLGYECVRDDYDRPDTLGIWYNIIAARTTTTGKYDYHFAKLTPGGWYHKPGKYAIMQFNDLPSNDVAWYEEVYDGEYKLGPHIYDSTITYISYKQNHGDTHYTWTGEHYHSNSSHYYLYAYECNDCGRPTETSWVVTPCSGLNCMTPWSNPDTPVEY